MTLDQSALLQVLEALKAADVDDRIRSPATTICQALIEAELTAVISVGPHERTDARTAQRNGSGPRTWPPRPGTWSYGSSSCGPPSRGQPDLHRPR